MAVRYITVNPINKLFKPVTRAFGDIAIVGSTDNDAIGPLKTPIPITNPDSLSYTARSTLSAAVAAADTSLPVTSGAGFPTGGPFIIVVESEQMNVTAIVVNAGAVSFTVTRGTNNTTAAAHANGTTVAYTSANTPVTDPAWFKGALGDAVRKCFDQTPGPTTVYAVRTAAADGANAVTNALAEVGKLDVQIVALANTPVGPGTQGKADIEALSSHVQAVSKTGGDGKERIGIAMLGKDLTDPSLLTGNMKESRMVMVAHKSSEDAAAAVAGTIAGYEPHISLLLKPVSLDMDGLLSDSDIDTLNKAQINWITSPVILGNGFFMGEGYTLGPVPQPQYIDIVRTIDDISFRLKAELIRSIGNLRISRSGLRALTSQMTAILEPLKQREVIDSYNVFVPLLVLLDKDPASLSDVELAEIHSAQGNRTVEAILTVEYAGAIHRLNITFNFE